MAVRSRFQNGGSRASPQSASFVVASVAEEFERRFVDGSASSSWAIRASVPST